MAHIGWACSHSLRPARFRCSTRWTMFGLFAKWRLPTNPSWRGLRRTSDKLETVTSRSQWHTRLRNHSSTLPRKLCEGDVMRFTHFPRIWTTLPKVCELMRKRNIYPLHDRSGMFREDLCNEQKSKDLTAGGSGSKSWMTFGCFIRSLGPFWAMLVFMVVSGAWLHNLSRLCHQINQMTCLFLVSFMIVSNCHQMALFVLEPSHGIIFLSKHLAAIFSALLEG